MDNPEDIEQSEPKPSRLSLWAAIAINCVVLFETLPFFSLPPGTAIRPMDWAALMFELTVGGLVVFPFVILVLWRHPKKVWPWLALVLALTPLPLSMCLLHFAENLRGIILEP